LILSIIVAQNCKQEQQKVVELKIKIQKEELEVQKRKELEKKSRPMSAEIKSTPKEENPSFGSFPFLRPLPHLSSSPDSSSFGGSPRVISREDFVGEDDEDWMLVEAIKRSLEGGSESNKAEAQSPHITEIVEESTSPTSHSNLPLNFSADSNTNPNSTANSSAIIQDKDILNLLTDNREETNNFETTCLQNNIDNINSNSKDSKQIHKSASPAENSKESSAPEDSTDSSSISSSSSIEEMEEEIAPRNKRNTEIAAEPLFQLVKNSNRADDPKIETDVKNRITVREHVSEEEDLELQEALRLSLI
jgi:hypothetical protein